MKTIQADKLNKSELLKKDFFKKSYKGDNIYFI